MGMLNYEQTAAWLMERDGFLILTHIRPDGDTVGCAAGLCRALREQGKTAHILPDPNTSGIYTPYLEGLLADEGYTPDTVVAVDGEILGKPRDEQDAKRMLRLLSGRSHEVVSGLCMLGKDRMGVAHEITRVTFDPLDDDTISRYLARTNPYDKAGAYAIQGEASCFIRGIEGDYFNVVGLPVHRLSLLYREIFQENLL